MASRWTPHIGTSNNNMANIKIANSYWAPTKGQVLHVLFLNLSNNSSDTEASNTVLQRR